MKSIVTLLFLFLSTNGFAAEELFLTGELFDQDNKKVATYERFQETKDGKVYDRAVYKDLDGEVMTEEKMESLNGELIRYDMDQQQLKEHAWIEATDKKVTFNLKKFRKNNFPQTVDRPKNFVVGFQIPPFIQKNWNSLVKGDTQKIEMGVWSRQEAIGFELSKESQKDGKLTIKMIPSSFLIRAVVSPIYFVFDEKSQDLLAYRGRAIPKEKRGRSYSDFQGEIRYQKVKK